MADNKKYYYMRLKENFFETDEMMYLEGLDEGYMFSNILLKLYLRSLKNDGVLMMNEYLPYDAKMIARFTNHSLSTVEKAIFEFKKLGLIELLDSGQMYMSNIELFVGKTTTEADRKRLGRKKAEEKLMIEKEDGLLSDKCPPEKELELELELKLKLENKDIKDVSTSSPAVQGKYENDINEIVNHLNLSTGVKNRPQTKSTVKLLTKILKEGYTVDNCKDVINFKTHEWINNAKMKGNLVPGTLFAFANFEKYMDQLMLANQPSNAYGQKKYQAPQQQAPSKEVIKLEPDHNGFDGTNLSYEFMNRGIDNDTLIAYYKKQMEITGKGVFDGKREIPLKEWIEDFQMFNTKSITQN